MSGRSTAKEEKAKWKKVEKQVKTVTAALEKYKGEVEKLREERDKLQNELGQVTQEKATVEKKLKEKAENFARLAEISKALKEKLQEEQAKGKVSKKRPRKEYEENQKAVSEKAAEENLASPSVCLGHGREPSIEMVLLEVLTKAKSKSFGEMEKTVAAEEILVLSQKCTIDSQTDFVQLLLEWKSMFCLEQQSMDVFVIFIHGVLGRHADPVEQWGSLNAALLHEFETTRVSDLSFLAQLLARISNFQKNRLLWMQGVLFCIRARRFDLFEYFTEENWEIPLHHSKVDSADVMVVGMLQSLQTDLDGIGPSSITKCLTEMHCPPRYLDLGATGAVDEILDLCEERFRDKDLSSPIASLRVICEHFGWPWTFNNLIRTSMWRRLGHAPESSGGACFRILSALVKHFHFHPQPDAGDWLLLHDSLAAILPPQDVDASCFLNGVEKVTFAYFQRCLADLHQAYVKTLRHSAS